jgi:hypothetical protein
MTFNSAALAIDGARIPSSLVRIGFYASTSSAQGVVSYSDLKVAPLDIPGNGFQISPGAGIVLNKYQTKPTQTYVVENPTPHIFPANAMPGVSASDRYFLVAIVIGDPEFSQVGHPFMGSEDPPEGQEETFNYVRPVLIPIGSSTVTEVSSSSRFPALVLARLRIRAGQATINPDDITDLRKLARPRSQEAIEHVAGPVAPDPLGSAWEQWPDVNVLTVEVPDWAARAIVTGFIEGARLTKAGKGDLRIGVKNKTQVSTSTSVDESAPTSGDRDRKSYNLGGKMDVSDLRGQTVTFVSQGSATGSGSSGFLTTDSATSLQIRVRFEEAPI